MHIASGDNISTICEWNMALSTFILTSREKRCYFTAISPFVFTLVNLITKRNVWYTTLIPCDWPTAASSVALFLRPAVLPCIACCRSAAPFCSSVHLLACGRIRRSSPSCCSLLGCSQPRWPPPPRSHSCRCLFAAAAMRRRAYQWQKAEAKAVQSLALARICTGSIAVIAAALESSSPCSLLICAIVGPGCRILCVYWLLKLSSSALRAAAAALDDTGFWDSKPEKIRSPPKWVDLGNFGPGFTCLTGQI